MLNTERSDSRDGSVDTGNSAVPSGEPVNSGSLLDDLTALADDGKTYVEAELAFQKTRFAFAANRGKSGAAYLVGAAALLHLALIGIVVGAIIGLADELGALVATLIVGGILSVAAFALLLFSRNKFSSMARSFKDDANV